MTTAPVIGYAIENDNPTEDNTPITLPTDEGSTQATGSVPDKFKREDGSVDVERLVASYAALEAKLGSSDTSDDDSSVSDESSEGDEEVSGSLTDEREQASSILDKAGLALSDVQKEFDETGSLSEETYKALQEKAGVPRELVDSYVAGLQARVDRLVTAAYETAGGQEAFEAMTEWAAENADEVFIEGFNAAAQSQDPKKIKKAVEALKKLYEREAPKTPKQIGGETSAVEGSVYKTTDEMTKDMADPRYDTDERFRKQVEDKIRRTLKANGKA